MGDPEGTPGTRLPRSVDDGRRDRRSDPDASDQGRTRFADRRRYRRRRSGSRAAIVTPLEYCPRLSARHGVQVCLKREDLQAVRSPSRSRGLQRDAQLGAAEAGARRRRHSADSHAQGVAFACRTMGCRAHLRALTTPKRSATASPGTAANSWSWSRDRRTPTMTRPTPHAPTSRSPVRRGSTVRRSAHRSRAGHHRTGDRRAAGRIAGADGRPGGRRRLSDRGDDLSVRDRPERPHPRRPAERSAVTGCRPGRWRAGHPRRDRFVRRQGCGAPREALAYTAVAAAAPTVTAHPDLDPYRRDQRR